MGKNSSPLSIEFSPRSNKSIIWAYSFFTLFNSLTDVIYEVANYFAFNLQAYHYTRLLYKRRENSKKFSSTLIHFLFVRREMETETRLFM